MKKITMMMLMVFTSTLMFGQTPIITMISDGDCAGGNPKVVELYADGAVDFSQYSLEIQTNENTDWGNALNLADLGTITDEFVYIHKEDADGGSFASEYPSATNVLTTTTSAVNFNGDDRIRIVQDSDGAVIDQYGAEGIDGTGEAWEYQDGYAKRNDGTGPDAGFFPGNWTFFGGDLDGEGTCQGGTAFETIIGIGSYTVGGGSNDPSIVITSPNNGATISPNTTSVDIVFATQNLPGDGQIDITVNGTTSNDVSSPFQITVATGNSYDVTVDIISGGSSVASNQITFEVASATEVANITALRADVEANGVGNYYVITGTSIMTKADGFNNRKWFQDNTPSGIMIYDANEVIADDAYMVGDNVEGLTGYTDEFNGVLQLIPTADAGVVIGNTTVLPQTVNLPDFIANFNDYESELIGFENVSIAEADGTVVFETGTNYNLTNGSETITARTEFFDADYIGEVIPTATSNIAGVASEFNGTGQLFIRNSDDLDAVLSNKNFENTEFALYPNPVKNGLVNIETKTGESLNVEFFNLLGQSVLKAETNQEVNVSNLKTGVYLVKIEQNNNTVTKKLIIK